MSDLLEVTTRPGLASPDGPPVRGATVFLCPQKCTHSVLQTLLDTLAGVRPDVKALIGRPKVLPEREGMVFCLEPQPYRILRASLRWLCAGGSLIVFLPDGGFPRSDFLPRAIRRTRAVTVPVFVTPEPTEGPTVGFGACIPAGRILNDDRAALHYLRWKIAQLDPGGPAPRRLVPRVA